MSTPRSYKICTDWHPGLGTRPPMRSASDQVASTERVDNVRVIPLNSRWGATRALSVPRHVTVARAAVEIRKMWQNGRKLRVAFMDGPTEVRERVSAIAKEWEQVANLRLDFVRSGAAEVRISFAEKGFSWSTVGTDALTVAASQPTMNYGWLEPSTATSEYQRVVRHEFGHALGMIHEHQNPAAQGQIPWDRPRVYAYYAQQGWSQADTDSNIFQVYSEESTNHTDFDPASIMQYAVPNSLTIGDFSIGWNTALSQLDREFMRQQYPPTAPGTVELQVGGPRVAVDRSGGGEVESYHFDVPAPATHIVTTEGPTDTVVTLHGPDDPGAVLTWDDDRGRGLNARIVRKLRAGSYWLSVRHKEPGATEGYTIGVKTRRG